MNCETCRGPVIGAGFFQRIVHERDCRKMKAFGEAFEAMFFPERPWRCEICRENISTLGMMCENCTRERSGAKG